MAKEAKKEAFRKYLESSGVLDALTKVLVALYEENDKPLAAIDLRNLGIQCPHQRTGKRYSSKET